MYLNITISLRYLIIRKKFMKNGFNCKKDFSRFLVGLGRKNNDYMIFGQVLHQLVKNKTIKMYLFNTISLRYLIIRKILMKNGFNCKKRFWSGWCHKNNDLNGFFYRWMLQK